VCPQFFQIDVRLRKILAVRPFALVEVGNGIEPKAVDAKQAAPRPDASASKSAAPKQDSKQAAARPPLRSSVSDSPAAAKDHQVSGSAPIVPPNSFDSRFGAVK